MKIAAISIQEYMTHFGRAQVPYCDKCHGIPFVGTYKCPKCDGYGYMPTKSGARAYRAGIDRRTWTSQNWDAQVNRTLRLIYDQEGDAVGKIIAKLRDQDD